MRLECPQCAVRDWSTADKGELVRAADNRKIWRNMTHLFPHPYREADADAWFALLADMGEPTHWAIEVDGRAAGGIGIVLGEGVYSHTASLGYWLAEPLWGRGVTTAAVRMVVPYAMERFGLSRIEAAVFAWNPGSMRVLETCGFVLEGVSRASVHKDGETIDRMVYALTDPSVGREPSQTAGHKEPVPQADREGGN